MDVLIIGILIMVMMGVCTYTIIREFRDFIVEMFETMEQELERREEEGRYTE